MLAAVLDGSDAARLDREVVRGSRLALQAGASYDGVNRGPGMFVMDGTPAPGKTVEELEQAEAHFRLVLASAVEDLRAVSAYYLGQILSRMNDGTRASRNFLLARRLSASKCPTYSTPAAYIPARYHWAKGWGRVPRRPDR